MTAYFLLKALCTFLREELADYSIQLGGDDVFRVPNVYEGLLPVSHSSSSLAADCPYVAPRILKGEDKMSRTGAYSTIYMEIVFGLYSERKKGDETYDLLHLMEHVRLALLRQSILAKKYRLEQPYAWQIPMEQPYPLWVGTATSIWTIPNNYDEIGAKTLYDV